MIETLCELAASVVGGCRFDRRSSTTCSVRSACLMACGARSTLEGGPRRWRGRPPSRVEPTNQVGRVRHKIMVVRRLHEWNGGTLPIATLRRDLFARLRRWERRQLGPRAGGCAPRPNGRPLVNGSMGGLSEIVSELVEVLQRLHHRTRLQRSAGAGGSHWESEQHAKRGGRRHGPTRRTAIKEEANGRAPMVRRRIMSCGSTQRLPRASLT